MIKFHRFKARQSAGATKGSIDNSSVQPIDFLPSASCKVQEEMIDWKRLIWTTQKHGIKLDADTCDVSDDSTRLLDLPDDALVDIFKFLHHTDLQSLSRTSKRLGRVCKSDYLAGNWLLTWSFASAQPDVQVLKFITKHSIHSVVAADVVCKGVKAAHDTKTASTGCLNTMCTVQPLGICKTRAMWLVANLAQQEGLNECLAWILDLEESAHQAEMQSSDPMVTADEALLKVMRRCFMVERALKQVVKQCDRAAQVSASRLCKGYAPTVGHVAWLQQFVKHLSPTLAQRIKLYEDCRQDVQDLKALQNSLSELSSFLDQHTDNLHVQMQSMQIVKFVIQLAQAPWIPEPLPGYCRIYLREALNSAAAPSNAETIRQILSRDVQLPTDNAHNGDAHDDATQDVITPRHTRVLNACHVNLFDLIKYEHKTITVRRPVSKAIDHLFIELQLKDKSAPMHRWAEEAFNTGIPARVSWVYRYLPADHRLIQTASQNNHPMLVTMTGCKCKALGEQHCTSQLVAPDQCAQLESRVYDVPDQASSAAIHDESGNDNPTGTSSTSSQSTTLLAESVSGDFTDQAAEASRDIPGAAVTISGDVTIQAAPPTTTSPGAATDATAATSDDSSRALTQHLHSKVSMSLLCPAFNSQKMQFLRASSQYDSFSPEMQCFISQHCLPAAVHSVDDLSWWQNAIDKQQASQADISIALVHAILQQSEGATELLIASGADLSWGLFASVRIAAAQGFLEAFEIMRRCRVLTSQIWCVALVEAAQKFQLPLLETLCGYLTGDAQAGRVTYTYSKMTSTATVSSSLLNPDSPPCFSYTCVVQGICRAMEEAAEGFLRTKVLDMLLNTWRCVRDMLLQRDAVFREYEADHEAQIAQHIGAIYSRAATYSDRVVTTWARLQLTSKVGSKASESTAVREAEWKLIVRGEEEVYRRTRYKRLFKRIKEVYEHVMLRIRVKIFLYRSGLSIW